MYIGYIDLLRSNTNNGGGERDAKRLKNNHYLEYLSDKDGNIKVRCTLCAGGDKVLSSYKNTTSNLKKHLELQHCTVKFTEQIPFL